MSAAFEQYLQPPAPDPERAPDDTSEPVGPAAEEIGGYLQPPPSNLRPVHAWDANASATPHPWVTRPAGHPIAAFCFSMTGHVLTWTSILLGMTLYARWGLPALALAAVSIVTGVVMSATALRRHRRGTVGGPGWAKAGLTLGIVWLLLAVGLVLLFFISGPMPEV